ncbi:Nuclear pore complex nucleoporin component, partial [Podochytrium sp. JEL0797]
KSLCLQADTEVSVAPAKACALAQVAMLLIDKHPDLLPVLLGRLMKRCPFVVPMYFKRDEGETMDDFNKRRRYKKSDDEWETEERYNERMCGMIRFYAGLTQIKSNSHAYEIDFGWQWLARVLNIHARKITAQLISSFLQVAGHALLETYQTQAVKLLTYIHETALPQMMTLSVPSAMQLQLFLEDDGGFVKTGRIAVLKGSEFTRD